MHVHALAYLNYIKAYIYRLVGWGLTALSAQIGHIVPCIHIQWHRTTLYIYISFCTRGSLLLTNTSVHCYYSRWPKYRTSKPHDATR